MSAHKGMKDNLLGSLEIALFMPRGAQRFNTCKSAMKKSFLIPILFLPLTIAMVLFAHPDGAMSAQSTQILAIIYSLRLALYLGGFFAFAYIMARTLDKMEDFNSFIAANNWITVPMAALTLIPILMSASGAYAWDQVYTLIAMITLYSCACTAFMATKIMRIPYELAIFMAITGMTIHQNALGFLKWAAVNTLNLLA